MQVTQETFQPEKPNGFIVLDGPNGAGKSTFQKKIADYLTQQNIACLCTREPGATTLGKQLRELVVEAKHGRPCPTAEMFLFSADRAQHIFEVILPAIQNQQIVICDRYYYSTTAFQGYGHGLDLEQLNTINKIAISNTLPDLVLLFDLPVEAGLARTRTRQSLEHDQFEEQELAFHQRLRTGFLEQSKSLSEPFAVIDASLDFTAVWEQILPFIQKLVSSIKK